MQHEHSLWGEMQLMTANSVQQSIKTNIPVTTMKQFCFSLAEWNETELKKSFFLRVTC